MSDVLKFQKKSEPVDRSMQARWGGHEVLFKDGYLSVPITFMRGLQEFGQPFKLTPAESMFVLHVMTYKWSKDAPYPGYKKLAAHMGVSLAYARKLGRDLEQKGLLHRLVRTGSTNKFDFTPLFDRLAKYAAGGIPVKQKKRKAAKNAA